MLGHVGARGTAFANVTLLDHVLDFDEIRVTSARPESRAAFGARLRGGARQAGPRRATTSRRRCAGADVVVEATRLPAPEPILQDGVDRARPRS